MCVCVCVCEGGQSCHYHFYSVLGVKYLTATIRYRLKPDA